MIPAVRTKRKIATKAISTTDAPRSRVDPIRRSRIDDRSFIDNRPEDGSRLLGLELDAVQETSNQRDRRTEGTGDHDPNAIFGGYNVVSWSRATLTVGIDRGSLPLVEEDPDVAVLQVGHDSTLFRNLAYLGAVGEVGDVIEVAVANGGAEASPLASCGVEGDMGCDEPAELEHAEDQQQEQRHDDCELNEARPALLTPPRAREGRVLGLPSPHIPVIGIQVERDTGR